MAEALAVILAGIGVAAFVTLAVLIGLAHLLLPVFIILWIMRK